MKQKTAVEIKHTVQEKAVDMGVRRIEMSKDSCRIHSNEVLRFKVMPLVYRKEKRDKKKTLQRNKEKENKSV